MLLHKAPFPVYLASSRSRSKSIFAGKNRPKNLPSSLDLNYMLSFNCHYCEGFLLQKSVYTSDFTDPNFLVAVYTKSINLYDLGIQCFSDSQKRLSCFSSHLAISSKVIIRSICPLPTICFTVGLSGKI